MKLVFNARTQMSTPYIRLCIKKKVMPNFVDKSAKTKTDLFLVSIFFNKQIKVQTKIMVCRKNLLNKGTDNGVLIEN